MEVHLDGQKLELTEGATLGDILPDWPQECSVAVIRPAEAETVATQNIRLTTTAGEVVVEITAGASHILTGGIFDPFFKTGDAGEIIDELKIRWTDRYTASFGTFASEIIPGKKPHRYEKGDVIIGCGGYDPEKSYLIFSKMNHTSDHGAPEDGGVIGKVVSGRNVLDRWKTGDTILQIERMISRADRSNSFTTKDPKLVLENGMSVISRISAVAEGYSKESVDTGAAISVEHMLLTLDGGRFWVGRQTSTHIRDEKMKRTDVPMEHKASRLEGTITVRTNGKSRGCIYIYTKDTPSSPYHTITGQVVHGIELVKLASDEDIFRIDVEPRQFDLRGKSLKEAKNIAIERDVRPIIDNEEGERVVIGQKPETTLEVLASGEVTLSTVPLSDVITITLYDENAPRTCEIFREISGLRWHNIGKIPLLFQFEDVFLFKPKIPKGMTINLENKPVGEVPANTLGMTNDSRKGSGLVGIRTTPNSEFGPTSEPFEGTNIIGKVLDAEKIKKAKEGDIIYIREEMA